MWTPTSAPAAVASSTTLEHDPIDALRAAVQNDDEAAVSRLLHASTVPTSTLLSARNAFGATLLMLSIEYDHNEYNSLPQMLLAEASNQDLEAVDFHGDSAFMYAVRWGNNTMMREIMRRAKATPGLLEKISRRELPPQQGERLEDDGLPTTAIALAAQHGLVDAVHILMGRPRADGRFGPCGWSDAELADALVRGSAAGCFNKTIASSASDEWATDSAVTGGTADSETRRQCFQGALIEGHVKIVRALSKHWVESGKKAGLAQTSVLDGFSAGAGGNTLLDVLDAHQAELIPDLVRLGSDPRVRCVADVHDTRASPFARAIADHHFEQALLMLAPIFHACPAVAVYASVRLGIMVQRASEACATSSPSESEELASLAERVATAHTLLIETLTEQRRFQLLRAPEVEASFRAAVRAEYTSVFFPPWMHTFFLARWRGEVVGALLGTGSAQWGGPAQLSLTRRVELLALVTAVVLPLLVLVGIPLAALAPPLEQLLTSRLESLGDEGEHVGKYRASGYCSRYRVWWVSFNLLREPLFKFLAAHSLNVVFAILIVGPTWGFDWTSDRSRAILILCWSAAQLACTCWRFLQNRIVSLDLGTNFIASLVVAVASGSMLVQQDPSGALAATSLAVTLIFLNTGTALMRTSQDLGPLVRMIRFMLMDTTRWLALWASVVICFFPSLLLSLSRADTGTSPAELLWYFAREGFAVADDPIMDIGSQTFSQATLLFTYRVVSGTLLVPLLGAIMFERYGAIWPDKLKYFQVEFATTVLRNSRRPVVPPPILALTLPMELMKATLRMVGRRGHTRTARSSVPERDVASRATETWQHDKDYQRSWPTERLIDLIDATSGATTGPEVARRRARRIFMTTAANGRRFSRLVPLEAPESKEGDDDDDEEEEEEGHGRDSVQATRAVSKDNALAEDMLVESDEFDEVRVHDGYNERVARVIFPYADRFAGTAPPNPVMHMTILADGTIENAPKELVLEGDMVQQERALCFFPWRQSMESRQALDHVHRDPNRNFVWQREDGTFAVCHCWPIKVCVRARERRFLWLHIRRATTCSFTALCCVHHPCHGSITRPSNPPLTSSSGSTLTSTSSTHAPSRRCVPA